MKITAIVLASGLSRRMGWNKLMMAIDGKPIISYIFDALKQVEFHQILVVTAYESIADLAESCGYRVVMNSEAESGQSRSVVLGVKNSLDSDGWLFINGDMPKLGADTIANILKYTQCGIVVPRYDGNPGQPVFFSKKYKDELLELTGDQGGRGIIRSHPEEVQYVEIADSIQGIDIDTWEDYKKIVRSEIQGGREICSEKDKQ